MNNKRSPLKAGMVSFGLTAMILISGPAQTFADSFLVIASRNVPNSTLSRAEIRDIFLGKKRTWKNNRAIQLTLLEDGTTSIDFLQNVIGQTPAQFDRHWTEWVANGKAALPPTFNESHQIVDYVATHPNAIGVISADKANGSVKVITIK